MSANLDRHKAALDQDPDDVLAFEALEEHYFMAGDWESLIPVYQQRLHALSFKKDPKSSVPLIFRLAQVLEDRCLDPDRAIPLLWKAAKLDPNFRQALRQLRRIHADRNQWDVVLQIAETESAIPMETFEKATFLTEIGEIWLTRLEDVNEALRHYQLALETSAQHSGALTGLARVHETQGHYAEAAAAWEQLASRLRGPDRAPVMVAMGKLFAGPLASLDQAIDCFRQALDDDPRSAEAADEMAAAADAKQDWPLLASLQERRFDHAAGARSRAAIAVEAGRLNLEKLDDTQAARMWFKRAEDLCDDDAAIYDASAELERRAGNTSALAHALDRVIELSGDAAPLSAMLEAADLATEQANEERALMLLRRAREKAPDNPLVIEALSDCLNRKGLRSELIEVLEERVGICAGDDEAKAEILVEMGRIHESDLGDADQAIECLAQAFALVPDIPDLATSLERLYRKREDWDALAALLEEAASRGPGDERGACFANLGQIRHERFADAESAGRAFESALELDPRSAIALRGLETLAVDSGDEDAILSAREREAAITTDHERLAFLVSQLVPRLESRGRTESALEWAEKLNQLQPESRAALEEVVRLREALGRQDETREALERLDAMLPPAEQAQNRRRIAVLHGEAERNEEAIAAYQSALEAEPGDLISLRALRLLYTESRDYTALAPTLRTLADVAPSEQSSALLDELSRLHEDQLADLDAAIEVLTQLVGLGEGTRPEDAATRLESLLERAGRLEELAQQLDDRRHEMTDTDARAPALDLRRAQLMLDPLSRYEESARLFEQVRRHADHREAASRGLEKALRASNDSERLVAFLAEEASLASDPTRAAQLRLERAVLLEEGLGEFDEAREALAELTCQSQAPGIADEAGEKLEQLLTRCGDWEALRDRMLSRLGRGDSAADLALHENLANLHRDRLNDRIGCIEHLEAAAALAPERADLWQKLAVLFRELERKPDLLRAIEAELVTEPDYDRSLTLHSQAARLCCELEGHASDASRHYEQLLVITPGHPEASEYLIDYYESRGMPVDVVRLLGERIQHINASFDSTPGAVNEAQCASRTSLRLRMANLQAEALADVDTAIETLEAAYAETGPTGAATAPLADLYQHSGASDRLIALCREAIPHSEQSRERARWQLRLGDTLRKAGDAGEACEAYRAVLSDCPGDLDAEAALRDLYRTRDEAGPLAELLESEIERRGAKDQIPVRMELAELLANSLNRQAEALAQLQCVLAEDNRNAHAFERAIALSRELRRHEETANLLAEGLAHAKLPIERAALLEQQAQLFAGPLERQDDAISHYRECLHIDPERRQARVAMRAILEELGRFSEVLDCLFVEAQGAQDAERLAIYERAADIAMREVSPDDALPWLERLLAENRGDTTILARMADIHRRSERYESLLRTLDAQLEEIDDASARRDLEVERAQILERELQAPGRALRALEAARALVPGDLSVLASLDRLHQSLGRLDERVEVIEARIAKGDPAANELHQSAASLWSQDLANPGRAIPHLESALALCGREAPEFLQLQRDLAEASLATGRHDIWAQAAENQLAHLIAVDAASEAQRVRELRWQLAESYSNLLGRGQAAERHLLALLADEVEDAESDAPSRGEVQLALIGHLRSDQNHVELERRLSDHLAAGNGDQSQWLELARLRSEQFHAPAAAMEAYREVLERDDGCLVAIRGLGHCAELVADAVTLAESLERELAQGADLNTEGRCALLRRLGNICWRRLPAPDNRFRAAKAFESVLEIDSSDVDVMRSLERIYEDLDDHSKAIELYQREVTALAGDQAERRQAIWLRIAEIARDLVENRKLAVRAFEEADYAQPLPLPRQREWADLLADKGDVEGFAEVFTRWCDADGSPAVCADQLRLGRTLRELGHPESALERIMEAARNNPKDVDAWELAADLQEEQGLITEATESLGEAAEIRGGSEAANRLLRAAHLLESEDPETTRKLLLRGVDHDPAATHIYARLAMVCERLEAWDEAVDAAGHALDLAIDGGALADSVKLEAAMSGGRSARQRDNLEAATRFFTCALSIQSEHLEALEAQGEVLHQCGDISSARHILERRLELEGDNPNLAHHLAVIGAGLELEENHPDALARYRESIEVDPSSDEAHAGLVRIHEATDSPGDARTALAQWIEMTSEANDRADRLVHMARLEIACGAKSDAEEHLRQATRENPQQPHSWTLLAELLCEQERTDDVIEATRNGLLTLPEDEHEARAQLGLSGGRALEQTQSESEAIVAYETAVEHDARCSEAALAQARILRNQGQWRDAADVLESFIAGHPEPDHNELARVHYKLGRLLAGPLEGVEEAVACYERALEIDPEFSRAHEPLAGLLVHIPARWKEAVEHHRELLAHEPLRPESLRALLRIAQERGAESAISNGLAIMRALGATSPSEYESASAHVGVLTASEPEFAEPESEKLRRLVQQVSQELSQALASRDATVSDAPLCVEPSFAPYRAFWDTMRGAIAESSAPGFETLATDEIALVLKQLTALTVEAPFEDGDSNVARSLDQLIGRWTRRKLRKVLDGSDLHDLEATDWRAWHEELLQMAACTALDRCDGDLRTALIVLSHDDYANEPEELSDATDITQRVCGSERATQLFERVTQSWCRDLASES